MNERRRSRVRGGAAEGSVRALRWSALGIVVLCTTLVLLACGKGGGGAPPGRTVDVSFQVRFPETMASYGAAPMVTKDPSAVQSLGVTVTETATSTLVRAETPLTFNDVTGTWEGTLTGLPTGLSLDFRANGYDGLALSGSVIYTDLATQTLTDGGPNTVTLNMVAIDLGPGTVPVVESVAMASSIETGSTGNPIEISILYAGSVDYDLTVALGTFAASGTNTLTGTHDPASGPLTVYYNAPPSSGAETITIQLVDAVAPGGTFTVVYPITLSVSAGATMVVNFGPAITALSFSRTETALAVTATASGAAPLAFGWSGTGSFAGLSGATETATIDPFDDTMAGDVIVTVTDSNGLSASVTHPIAAGDFPYSLIGTFTPLADSLALYEDFSGTLLGTKWSEPSFLSIGIVGGQLELHLETPIHDYAGRELRLLSPEGIQGIAADVSVTGVSGSTYGDGHVDLDGVFYNDGTGDILARISIDHRGNVYYNVSRGDWEWLDGGPLGTVTPGTSHALSLSWDGGSVFSFMLDGPPALVVDAAAFGASYAGPAVGPRRALSIAGAIGQYDGVVDNVLVDTGGGFALYDDFGAPDGLLDTSLWDSGERAGAIAAGAWQAFNRNSSLEMSIRTPTLAWAMAADVTVTAQSGSGRAHIGKAFYQDGAGNAIFGTIGLTDSQAIASVLAVALGPTGEPAGSTVLYTTVLGAATLGTPHTLYFDWDGLAIRFQFDDRAPVSMNPVAMGYPVAGEIDFAGLLAGAFDESAAFVSPPPGTVEATFDNVRVGFGSPVDAALPSGGIITGVWAKCEFDPFTGGSHWIHAEASGQEFRLSDSWFLADPACGGPVDYAVQSTARFFDDGTKTLTTGELVTLVNVEWTGETVLPQTVAGADALNLMNPPAGAYGFADWTPGVLKDVTGLDQSGGFVGRGSEKDIFYIDELALPNRFDIGLKPGDGGTVDPLGYPETLSGLNLERQP